MQNIFRTQPKGKISIKKSINKNLQKQTENLFRSVHTAQHNRDPKKKRINDDVSNK